MKQKRHSHAVNISLQLKKRSISHLRKRRSDAVTSRIKSYVSEFYFESSRPLPHKRYATKYGPAYVLQTTLKSAYRELRGKYPDIKISFTTFYSLRHKNIRLLSKSHWEYCVCILFQNIKYKLQSINSVLLKVNLPKLKQNDIENVILCPKGDNQRFYGAQCVYGACISCSDYSCSIRDHYKELLEMTPLP